MSTTEATMPTSTDADLDEGLAALDDAVADASSIQIALVIDRSSSMEAVRGVTISQFNEFLDEQRKQPGRAYLTLAFFDTQVEMRYANTPIEDVANLTHETYRPSGMTALYDAIGYTVREVERWRQGHKMEAPDKVLVAVITDGEENSSKEYKLDNIKNLIERHEGEGWAFTFLSSAPDSWGQAESMGFNQRRTKGMAANAAGHGSAMHSFTQSVSAYRGAAPGSEYVHQDDEPTT